MHTLFHYFLTLFIGTLLFLVIKTLKEGKALKEMERNRISIFCKYFIINT